MADIESPEDFAERLVYSAQITNGSVFHALKLIRARDAAVRRDAQQWRPLTPDPASWPEEGQVVVGMSDHGHPHLFRWSADDADWIAAWLPLPDLQPKGNGQ